VEPLIKSHVTATIGWPLTQTRSEERRVLDHTPATSDKVWGEARPGLGLAQRGAGRGAKLLQEALLNGTLMLPLPHPKLCLPCRCSPRPFGLRQNAALAALLGLALLRDSAAPSRLIPISTATRFMRDLIRGS